MLYNTCQHLPCWRIINLCHFWICVTTIDIKCRREMVWYESWPELTKVLLNTYNFYYLVKYKNIIFFFFYYELCSLFIYYKALNRFRKRRRKPETFDVLLRTETKTDQIPDQNRFQKNCGNRLVTLFFCSLTRFLSAIWLVMLTSVVHSSEENTNITFQRSLCTGMTDRIHSTQSVKVNHKR